MIWKYRNAFFDKLWLVCSGNSLWHLFRDYFLFLDSRRLSTFISENLISWYFPSATEVRSLVTYLWGSVIDQGIEPGHMWATKSLPLSKPSSLLVSAQLNNAEICCLICRLNVKDLRGPRSNYKHVASDFQPKERTVFCSLGTGRGFFFHLWYLAISQHCLQCTIGISFGLLFVGF